jgi:hypothetical protein
MTPELLILLGPYIAGAVAIITSLIAIYFARHERRAIIGNLDSDTIKNQAETVAILEERADSLSTRLNNIEAELGEEKSLRRRDKKTTADDLASMQKRHEMELTDVIKKHDYEMKSLELRVKELEDALVRSEKATMKAQLERDEARAENHGLLEENYKLRMEIAGKK